MASSVAKAAGRTMPESFRLGSKQVFLPTHVITLLRREQHPPNWAHFQVPLSFSKLDLRDYLWNLYGIEAKHIRSGVIQSSPERSKNGRGAWTRQPSTKFMTIEMTKPFVWPEVPEDKKPWNHEMWEAREKSSQEALKKQKMRAKGQLPSPTKQTTSLDREALRKRAQMMLKGQIEWSTDAKLDEKWDKAQQLKEENKTLKETGSGEKKA